MSIRIRKMVIVYDSITCEAIEPRYLSISEEELKEYMKKNPMPKDKHYTEEDLLSDIKCSGFWQLPDAIKEETTIWIEEMIEELFH